MAPTTRNKSRIEKLHKVEDNHIKAEDKRIIESVNNIKGIKKLKSLYKGTFLFTYMCIFRGDILAS